MPLMELFVILEIDSPSSHSLYYAEKSTKVCQKLNFCIIKIKYNHTDWKVNNDRIFIFGLTVLFYSPISL